MAQAILVAILAGGAAALLSGLLTPGIIPFFMLFFVAPLPLMIAGLGWHVLVAALGALFGILLVNFGVGFRGAIGFAGMVGFPAYLASLVFVRLFQTSDRPERDGDRLGQLYMALAGYVALAIVGSAIAVQPDFDLFESGLRKMMAEAVKIMSAGAMEPKGGEAALSVIVEAMTGLIMPISTLMIIATLVISGTLAMMIVERSKRLGVIAPDLRLLRLPGGAIILFGMAVLMGMRTGYLGLFAELIAVGLAFGFILQGLGVMHVRLGGKPGGGMLIGLAWLVTIVFGLPALGFLILGMVDHLLNFRKGRL